MLSICELEVAVAIEELDDNDFDQRSKLLISDYADLVKKGLPEKGLAEWNDKMEKLPPLARKTIEQLVFIEPCLLDALAERGDFKAR